MKKNCLICLNKTNLFLEKKNQPTKIFPTSNFKGLKKKDCKAILEEVRNYKRGSKKAFSSSSLTNFKLTLLKSSIEDTGKINS